MLNKKIKANAISNNISFQWNSEQSIPVYGLQAISKINDKIFGVIIKDNIIGFYTIDKENNLILLADYEQDRAYPIENGSGIAFTNEEDNKKWDKKNLLSIFNKWWKKYCTNTIFYFRLKWWS
ncbi:hypothetical protein [Spiroplasma endosymbiont of Tiphia femorata]|uniref:hypothetical protein n=1 Tax=Spiroplasma endosymbiont of Tiphia femorata TaxID=3066326 RepID=UPI0030D3FFF5